MKNKIKIILSYFEINNEPNKYKIKINTIDFIIKANNQSIFKYKKYINDSFENVAEMKFDTNNKKYTKTINKASKIISLDVLNKQIYKNYKRKYKELYFANNIIIQYDYKKKWYNFFYNHNILYRYNITYYNGFKYKFQRYHSWGKKNIFHTMFISNKYNLQYDSTFFIMF